MKHGQKVLLKETGEEGKILDHAHEPGWVHVAAGGYVYYLREEGVEEIAE